MNYELTYSSVNPDSKIITLELAKANAKIDYNEEDELFQLYIDGIGIEIENYTGRKFLQRTAVMTIPKWNNEIEIPVYGNAVVNEIKYRDITDSEAILEKEFYRQINFDDGSFSKIRFSIDPFPELYENHPVKIALDVGYPTAEIPADIKVAALLMFNNFEAYREDMPIHLNRSAQAKLKPYKIYRK